MQDVRPPGDRVRALLLEDAAQGTALEAFLRQVADRSPLQAARELESCHDLWLGPLKPRFSGEALQRVEHSR